MTRSAATSDAIESFERECREQIARQGKDPDLRRLTRSLFNATIASKYSYHFRALGRPIIQYPQDMVAVQELIWDIKPDLIIETGIAHGGSLIMSASMLALLDYAEAVEGNGVLDVRASKRRVVGIDIDIRSHNREAIDANPLRHKIEMIQVSSIAPEMIEQVHEYASDYRKILVMLDSNHTHDHVLAELQAYAPLVSPGSYCVVFDTVIEDLPPDSFDDRPWKVGNNPKTAVREYLNVLSTGRIIAADGKPLLLEVDNDIEHKLLMTVAPGGYLRRQR